MEDPQSPVPFLFSAHTTRYARHTNLWAGKGKENREATVRASFFVSSIIFWLIPDKHKFLYLFISGDSLSGITQKIEIEEVFDRSQHMDEYTSFLFLVQCCDYLSKTKKDETYIFHFSVLTASRRPVSTSYLCVCDDMAA
jgi:hypothetical protein